MAEQDKDWHLDKRVNVSLMAVMAMQIVAGVYAYALMTAQVSANTGDIIRSEERMNIRMDRNYSQATQRYEQISRALIRIEDKLDNKVDK